MQTIETFVTLSVHEGTNANGQSVRFIRARFQVGENQYLTAFNPQGVKSVELVKRVSRTTGKTRVQTRFPVLVTFERDSVVGSDVVASCKLEPRAFQPTAMASADAASLAAFDAAFGAAPATPATPATPVPAPAAEEPLA